MFCSLQLELERPNYMNRNIEPFKRCLVMQRTLVKSMHRKIVYVKVESSVIKISESVHWSRRCYAISFISVWNEIVLVSQGTVNQTTSCQHTPSKKHTLVQHIGAVQSCQNRNKTSVPLFYSGNNMGTRSGAHSWFNSYAPELVPML